MHILIAPNAFKNSLSAEDTSEAIRLGLMQSALDCTVQCFPIGDGGDGTARLIVKNSQGFFKETFVQDPLGRKIKAAVGFIDEGKTAVIEMADASGLKLLQKQEFDPLHATSFGTGELILAALDNGAQKIILCIGGSATVDGGCGILQALGVRFLDRFKNNLKGLPESLIHLDTFDMSGFDNRILQVEFIVLCDVDNFLLGEKGSAAVFGPQKGASSQDVVILEKSLQKLRDVALQQTGKDMNAIRHGGAAGGVAAASNIFFYANLEQGIEWFLNKTGFDEACQKTDLLITGEGSIDLQTLKGKAPFGVARRAKQMHIPVIGLAGQIEKTAGTQLSEFFDQLFEINGAGEDIETAMKNTAVNLQRTAFEIGQRLSES